MRVAIAAAAILAVSACAAPAALPPTVHFPVEAASDTFGAGYRQISERYIEALPVSEVALAGMSGLHSLEPSLEVRREGDDVVLALEGEDLRRFPAPGNDDIDAWSRLTADVSAAAAEASAALRDAPVERIYEAVFDSVLADLDRFSRYNGAERATENRARRRGFGGIGIQYDWTEAGAVIRKVIAASPAQVAGLRPGDVVTHVGGSPVAGVSRGDFSDWLRGPVDSPLSLTVERDRSGEPLSFELTRTRIHFPTVTVDTKDGIVVARVSGFNSHTARQLSDLFAVAERTSPEPIRGVVMDLRGNPGGLLRQAVSVADLFLAQGQIVSTQGRHPESLHDYSARKSDLADGLPLVVIINGRSASSAEIVAAALQDHDRAVVIGTTSYGKGTVQTVARLPNDGELTLTWSRFMAPSGYLLHDLGVVPTVCTSGSADANAAVVDALEHMAKTQRVVAEWRSIAFEDRAGRERLRATCPASGADGDLDLEVARILLSEKETYRNVAAGAPRMAASASHIAGAR